MSPPKVQENTFRSWKIISVVSECIPGGWEIIPGSRESFPMGRENFPGLRENIPGA
jgi:hypothetical protein